MKRLVRLFALALAVRAGAREGAPPPDARSLVVRALSAPAAGFTAVGRIQSFRPGRRPKGLGMTMYVLPDGRSRRDIRKGARSEPELVFVDDGRRRLMYWPRLKTLWTGDSPREAPAAEADRLASLYALSVSAGGRVAARPTWRLDMRAPDGVLRRSWWVDRRTGLLTKCEEYRPDGALARRERFTRVLDGPPDPALFRLDVPSGTMTAPLNEPRADAPAPPGLPARFPGWIPKGYFALDIRVGSQEGAPALFVGYGDGASTFQVVEAAPGADFGVDERSARALPLGSGERAVLASGPEGETLVRRTRDRAYAVRGDLTEDEMERVAESLEAPR